MADAEPATPEADCTAASLFEGVWEAMADVLGTAATATLMRRAIKRAMPRAPVLDALMVRRVGFEYSYTLPERWRRSDPDPVSALRILAQELTPLLVELTGPVVIRRLNAHPELKRCKLSFQERGDERHATYSVGEHR